MSGKEDEIPPEEEKEHQPTDQKITIIRVLREIRDCLNEKVKNEKMDEIIEEYTSKLPEEEGELILMLLRSALHFHRSKI